MFRATLGYYLLSIFVISVSLALWMQPLPDSAISNIQYSGTSPLSKNSHSLAELSLRTIRSTPVRVLAILVGVCSLSHLVATSLQLKDEHSLLVYMAVSLAGITAIYMVDLYRHGEFTFGFTETVVIAISLGIGFEMTNSVYARLFRRLDPDGCN